jgi:hypothetical protein
MLRNQLNIIKNQTSVLEVDAFSALRKAAALVAAIGMKARQEFKTV